MSELQPKDNRNKRPGFHSKKLSTRVDLTPMVDLGFLLITFFIFTTTLNEPKGFKLVVPDESPTKNETFTSEGKTISLILEDNNVIHYYQGLDKAQSKSTNYSVSGIRAVIRQKILEVKDHYGKNADAVILIKPTNAASYKNIIAVLDEMLINDVKKYVLIDPSTEEKSL